MPSRRRSQPGAPKATTSRQLQDVLAWLKRRGRKRNRDGMARYAITAKKAFGVSMATMQQLAKRLGRNRKLAAALWKSGWHEARVLTAFVDDPEQVTAAQMERWARDFDNWAVCDTLCFKLFDRSKHAWKQIERWSLRKEEYVKRAAFALLASVALHDKDVPDARFKRALRLIERAADDERNFVKKGVSWALRGIGRRNTSLNAAAVNVARRLSASSQPSARWIGKDALRELTGPVVRRQLARTARSIRP